MELSYKKKGTSTPGEGEERFPHSENPLMGQLAGTERDLWWIKGKCSGWCEEGRTKWKLGSCSVPQPCASQHESSVSSCGGVWVLESGVWSVNLGGWQLLTVKGHPGRTGVRIPVTGDVWRGSPEHHRSKVSLLDGAQAGGQGRHHCAASPTHCHLSLWAMGGALFWAGLLTPQTKASLPA